MDCGEPGIDTADDVAAPSLPVRGDSIVRSPIRSYSPPEGTVSWRTCKLALLSLELKKRKIEFVLIRQGMKRCVSDLTCCIPRSPVRRPLPCVTTSIWAGGGRTSVRTAARTGVGRTTGRGRAESWALTWAHERSFGSGWRRAAAFGLGRANWWRLYRSAFYDSEANLLPHNTAVVRHRRR